MARKVIALHHAGTDQDNPILSGLAIRINLYKQSDEQQVKKCYVIVDGEVWVDLTDRVVETDTLAYVDVTTGVDLAADFPAKKNVVHFTTTPHNNSKRIIWVATEPAAMITLDGYNAKDPVKPLIYPIYRTE